jgi:hypothetical protein
MIPANASTYDDGNCECKRKGPVVIERVGANVDGCGQADHGDDQERDPCSLGELYGPLVQFAFSFHCLVKCAVHRQRDEGDQASEYGIPIEDS